ncbi:hypothetical protein DFH27DRAFT_531910 [Peziza echinospora]|nr:hypothetical protein DFH27DRAFT_531910 [Peziza echinospora]
MAYRPPSSSFNCLISFSPLFSFFHSLRTPHALVGLFIFLCVWEIWVLPLATFVSGFLSWLHIGSLQVRFHLAFFSNSLFLGMGFTFAIGFFRGALFTLGLILFALHADDILFTLYFFLFSFLFHRPFLYILLSNSLKHISLSSFVFDFPRLSELELPFTLRGAF